MIEVCWLPEPATTANFSAGCPVGAAGCFFCRLRLLEELSSSPARHGWPIGKWLGRWLAQQPVAASNPLFNGPWSMSH